MSTAKRLGLKVPSISRVQDMGWPEKIESVELTDAQLAELYTLLKREMEKTAPLHRAMERIKERLLHSYESRPVAERNTLRTDAVQVTYTAPGDTREIVDRDKLLDALSADQLRACAKIDVGMLEHVMRKEDFEKHTKPKRSRRSNVAVKDLGGDPENV